jgi:hypothetical protein
MVVHYVKNNMKDYVIKSLKETFAYGSRAEIHLAGCSHLKKNVSQVSRVLQANSVEDILVEYVDNDNGERENYRIAPCAK